MKIDADAGKSREKINNLLAKTMIPLSHLSILNQIEKEINK